MTGVILENFALRSNTYGLNKGKKSMRLKAMVMSAAAAVTVFQPIAHAAPSPRDQIVFMRDKLDPATGDVVMGGKLWLRETDGSHLRQISFGDSYDDHPSLYPDGQAVLFTKFPVNNRLEYRRTYQDHRPYWVRKDGVGGLTLDSDRLPVERAADAPLVRLDLRTGKQTVVLHIAGCQLHHANISAVDGRISYQADCNGTSQRWIGLPPAGKPIVTFATNGVALPDGAIFQSEPDKTKASAKRDVQIVRFRNLADAAVFTPLTDAGRNRRPSLSPSGDIFAWQANRPGPDDDIWVARIDGTEARDVTSAPGNDAHPWFARDGRTIVFESDRTGEWEIWKLDLPTARQTQLTFGNGAYSSTRARPVATAQ